MNKKIIGLTGPMGGGKTTASKILRAKGYKSFSFSNIIKQEAVKLGLPIDDRQILQDVGDQLRKSFGLDVLAKRTHEVFKFSNDNLVVIDGIRNPGELKYIQKVGGFVIGIDTPIELRFHRVLIRGNPYDPKTREEFEKAERRDRGVGQKSYGQQAEECLRLSNVVIENNGTLENFEKKILKILRSTTSG